MNISLENKTAIVCGSTQGIGKACAMELAGLGAGGWRDFGGVGG